MYSSGRSTRPIHALGSARAPARTASFSFIAIRCFIEARDGLFVSAAST